MKGSEGYQLGRYLIKIAKLNRCNMVEAFNLLNVWWVNHPMVYDANQAAREFIGTETDRLN